MVIQINGKLRDKMAIERDAKKEDVEKAALSAGRIPRLLEGKKVVKVVVVPNKLVNIVAR